MSDVEALMWNLEKDPYLASSFANVTLLDQPPDPDRLRARLAHAVSVVPRLRQRVAPALGRLAPPEWQDDPNFDLDYHIRHIALPAPGTERTLFDLAAVLAARRSTARGRCGSSRSSTASATAAPRCSRRSTTPSPTAKAACACRRSSSTSAARAARRPPEPVRRAGEPTRRPNQRRPRTSLPPRARLPLTTSVAASGSAAAPPAARPTCSATPIASPPPGSRRSASVQSLARQVAVTDRAHSPLWTERSLRRRFEVLRIPLDDTKRAAKALGGSVNDLFVAGAAGAAGAYHRAKGVDVDELRISMPVSTRTDRSMGGNAFTPARVLVPVGPTDPVERFTAVRDV